MIHRFSLFEKILLQLNVIPHPLLDLSGIVAGRALQLSIKMGIVDTIEDAPKSIPVIAQKTGISEQGAQCILECLDALGYVRKQAEEYGLTRRGKKFLLQNSPSNFRNMLLFSDYLFNNSMEAEVTIKSGGPDCTNYESFTPALWELFTKTMIEIAQTNVPEVTKSIPLPVQAKKLLDLGGSHGLYSIALCENTPSLSAEVMDFSPVESFANLIIAQHQMTDRVKFRAGDFVKDNLGSNYDVILACNIIHGHCEKDNKILAKKVYKALNSGGIYVILDQIKDKKRKSQLSRLITSSMGLSLFQQTGGRCYGFEEIRAWLKEVGFDDCERKKLRTPGFALIIGRKETNKKNPRCKQRGISLALKKLGKIIAP